MAGSEQSRLPSVRCVGLTNRSKAWMEQRLTSPRQEGTLPADGLWTWTATLHWVSSLPDYSTDFGFTETLQLCEPILSVSVSVSLYAHPDAFISFFWRTLTNTHFHLQVRSIFYLPLTSYVTEHNIYYSLIFTQSIVFDWKKDIRKWDLFHPSLWTMVFK